MIQVGTKVTDSPVGAGVVTGVTPAGYPIVNHVAVGRVKTECGKVFDPNGWYRNPRGDKLTK